MAMKCLLILPSNGRLICLLSLKVSVQVILYRVLHLLFSHRSDPIYYVVVQHIPVSGGYINASPWLSSWRRLEATVSDRPILTPEKESHIKKQQLTLIQMWYLSQDECWTPTCAGRMIVGRDKTVTLILTIFSLPVKEEEEVRCSARTVSTLKGQSLLSSRGDPVAYQGSGGQAQDPISLL
jgi:hypothetical protein